MVTSEQTNFSNFVTEEIQESTTVRQLLLIIQEQSRNPEVVLETLTRVRQCLARVPGSLDASL